MIELTINEKKISVEANTTILDAARSAGVHIPTLCAYKGLSPAGACRVCVVEVEGERKPVASCHTPAQNGMVVKTDTPKLWELRKMMVGLILATHPLDCPVCDKGGECELQDITHTFEIKEPKYKLNNPLRTKVGANPFLYIDFQKCIQCVRCARYTEEIEGTKTFDYHGSGGYSFEMDRKPENDTETGPIAGVIAVCPVGSLLDHPFKLRSRRPWDLTKTQTTCPHCSDGCQIVLNTYRNDIYRITAVSETDFSQGHPCIRGRFGYGFINHPTRLNGPLNRIAGVQKEASWEEVFERATSGLRDIKEKYGPETIWGLASTRLTNEEHLAFDSLFSSIGGNVVLSSCVANTAISGIREVMGEGYSRPITYIDNADFIIVTGSDLTETNPFLANRISRNARLKESRSVVINPRKIELCKSSWRWLAPRPGTETALLTWIGKRLEAVLKKGNTAEWLNALDEKQLESLTGVSARQVEEVAAAISKAERPCVVVGDDYSCSDNRSLGIAASNLLILTGKADREGTGLFHVLSESNSWGALAIHSDAKDAGALYRAIKEGRVKALYIAGEDPIGDWPGGWNETLRTLELLIVQDSNMTKTSEAADMVLPSRTFAEMDGTYSGCQGETRIINRSLKPPENTRQGFEIIEELAKRLKWSIGTPSEHPLQKKQTESSSGRHIVPVSILSTPEPKKDFPFLLLTGKKLYGSYSLFEKCRPLLDAAPEAIIEINTKDAGMLSIKDGSRVRVVSEISSVQVRVSVKDSVLSGNVYLPIHPVNGSQKLIAPDGAPCFVNIEAV